MPKNPVSTGPRHNSAMASSANSAALLQRHKPPRLRHETLNENNHEMFLNWPPGRKGNMFFGFPCSWFAMKSKKCFSSAQYGHTLNTIGWVYIHASFTEHPHCRSICAKEMRINATPLLKLALQRVAGVMEMLPPPPMFRYR